ncbi:MAG: hypothetical protein GWN79_29035, partial [Actinobacteria bacterium]|nr:hypothetical protein [Actinomycetota bacterium]NIV91064.1 hypothetical protein [Actinomycetota bacterium]NIW33801.1 hypothetical protein [Actinomycetota bacterium]
MRDGIVGGLGHHVTSVGCPREYVGDRHAGQPRLVETGEPTAPALFADDQHGQLGAVGRQHRPAEDVALGGQVLAGAVPIDAGQSDVVPDRFAGQERQRPVGHEDELGRAGVALDLNPLLHGPGRAGELEALEVERPRDQAVRLDVEQVPGGVPTVHPDAVRHDAHFTGIEREYRQPGVVVGEPLAGADAEQDAAVGQQAGQPVLKARAVRGQRRALAAGGGDAAQRTVLARRGDDGA